MDREQLAALRAAAQAAQYPDPMDEIRIRCAYRAAARPATILALLDHIAKLEAGRDAADARLHEVAVACATAEQERDALRAKADLYDWVLEQDVMINGNGFSISVGCDPGKLDTAIKAAREA